MIYHKRTETFPFIGGINNKLFYEFYKIFFMVYHSRNCFPLLLFVDDEYDGDDDDVYVVYENLIIA